MSHFVPHYNPQRIASGLNCGFWNNHNPAGAFRAYSARERGLFQIAHAPNVFRRISAFYRQFASVRLVVFDGRQDADAARRAHKMRLELDERRGLLRVGAYGRE